MRDAKAAQLWNTGIATLYADYKSMKRLMIYYPMDAVINVYAYSLGRIRFGELVHSEAVRCAEDHIDYIGFTLLHDPLRCRPLHGLKLHLYAGLGLPNLPEINQITLGLTVRSQEEIRRIIIVRDNS